MEHRKCSVWNTGDVLLGTHEMSCLEHTRCPAWNTRDVLLGTHEMSCLEHRKCPASRALAAKPNADAERGIPHSLGWATTGYDDDEEHGAQNLFKI